MDSNLIINGASDGAGSSVYEDRINCLPDHLRLHYILSLNGLTSSHPELPAHGRIFEFHDRISLLPDDLLHRILSFLPTQDAIRTSVLSQRWQRIWINLPTFAFSDDTRSAAGFANSVDDVLAHSYGMDKLEISVRHPSHLARANEWLQHAAKRAREKISFIFRYDGESIFATHDCDRVVLDLPCGGMATAMAFHLRPIGVDTLVIPPASAGVSSSLTQLELKRLRIDGSSLSNFVSSCCPHRRPSARIHPSRVEFAHSLATIRRLDVGLATHFMVNRTLWHYNRLAVWLLQRCTGVRGLTVALCNLHPSVCSLGEVWRKGT